MWSQNAAFVSELEVRLKSLELDLAIKIDALQSRFDELRGISLEIQESPSSGTLPKTPPQALLEMSDVSVSLNNLSFLQKPRHLFSVYHAGSCTCFHTFPFLGFKLFVLHSYVVVVQRVSPFDNDKRSRIP
uniref:PKcGMP_CC domain-containing protein n=1 Tax=Mesocestoides corti TaxID=53468 RepID=A0A5K3G0U1_MESCO